MIQEGNLVQGVDMNNNQIQGTVTNVSSLFGVAIARISDDRLGLTQCYVNNLAKKNNTKRKTDQN